MDAEPVVSQDLTDSEILGHIDGLPIYKTRHLDPPEIDTHGEILESALLTHAFAPGEHLQQIVLDEQDRIDAGKLKKKALDKRQKRLNSKSSTSTSPQGPGCTSSSQDASQPVICVPETPSLVSDQPPDVACKPHTIAHINDPAASPSPIPHPEPNPDMDHSGWTTYLTGKRKNRSSKLVVVHQSQLAQRGARHPWTDSLREVVLLLSITSRTPRRVASDGKEAKQRARGLSSSTAFSASEEERDRKSKIGKKEKRVLFLLCPPPPVHERQSLISRPKLCLSRVLGKQGRGAGRLLPGCCPGWPDLPTQGLDPVDRKGRGMQKLETGQRGYANGRIMRRLLRTLGAGRHPDARASFFLSPLAELLPRDGEKRRKARQRSRKGRPQPESARETGREKLPAAPDMDHSGWTTYFSSKRKTKSNKVMETPAPTRANRRTTSLDRPSSGSRYAPLTHLSDSEEDHHHVAQELEVRTTPVPDLDATPDLAALFPVSLLSDAQHFGTEADDLSSPD
ncbi:hypothetical protein NDU88_002627 [Pleurodeles waltl]|uniref:Uncharacterized protein n=1 Tax=Pleurodeles waltl TaxID=8319 RepID=A0AAV7RG42_PLEWA|nr:hypothetical protein NDU88_002627 [Pleurodeles waltl]